MTRILTPREYRTLMRRDLLAFVHRVFLHLHPATAFLSNWHIELLVAVLEQCRLGNCLRLIINLPPRSLKSITTSVAFPAWVLGHDPTRQFICASYAAPLADKHARDCRNVMESDWYRKLFPKMQLSPERNAVTEYTTTSNGGRIATSVGGTITGLGADFFIIDDPLKPEDALSEVKREAANDWFGHTVYNRLNDRRTGCIIIVMQRHHVDDLVGRLQRQTAEHWEVLNLPAIAEQPQGFEWQTWLGRFRHDRAVGDVLHPDREPREELEKIRAQQGQYTFAAQYQQNPVPFGGGRTLSKQSIRTYRADELPTQGLVFQSWDTATKSNANADYSVCITLQVVDGEKFYVRHVLRQRLDYPNLKAAVQRQRRLFQPLAILIEESASGTSLIQDLRDSGLREIHPYRPCCDKVTRFAAQTDLFENGQVYVPEQADWLADYLDEVTGFPYARYDDQVDATAQALEWLRKQRWNGWNHVAACRHLAIEATSDPLDQEVEMIAPQRLTTTIYLSTGQLLRPKPSERIRVPRLDIGGLMNLGFTLA